MQEMRHAVTGEISCEYFHAETAERLKAKMDARRSEQRGFTLVRRAKVGRNDPCPCGSGKKFKKCHIDNVEALDLR